MSRIRSKSAGNAHYLHQKPKISTFEPHWTTGINRRQFIQSTAVIALLLSIAGCKPSASDTPKIVKPKLKSNIETVKIPYETFSTEQKLDLDAIFMRLFPDDGDGPSANDLNVTTYLEWAMTDARNLNDGDPEFIIKGIGWLNQLAQDEQGDIFRTLSDKKQDALITKTIQSETGRNWTSILLYYVVEALTLDPFYGGNTNQVGWQWLEHQGGFPHPIAGKTYRDFE